MPKKVEFKEEAFDGDADGFVQDGTEFERQVVEEAPTALVEAPKAISEPASTHTVTYGDTYPSIAAKYPKAGLTKYERAKELVALNKNAILTGNRIIKL